MSVIYLDAYRPVTRISKNRLEKALAWVSWHPPRAREQNMNTDSPQYIENTKEHEDAALNALRTALVNIEHAINCGGNARLRTGGLAALKNFTEDAHESLCNQIQTRRNKEYTDERS